MLAGKIASVSTFTSSVSHKMSFGGGVSARINKNKLTIENVFKRSVLRKVSINAQLLPWVNCNPFALFKFSSNEQVGMLLQKRMRNIDHGYRGLGGE